MEGIRTLTIRALWPSARRKKRHQKFRGRIVALLTIHCESRPVRSQSVFSETQGARYFLPESESSHGQRNYWEENGNHLLGKIPICFYGRKEVFPHSRNVHRETLDYLEP